MRVSLPTRVLPRNWTKGSMAVSAPTSTSLSITHVSGKNNGDALAISCWHLASAHVLIDLREFGAGVAAQNFVGIAGLHGDDALFGLARIAAMSVR